MGEGQTTSFRVRAKRTVDGIRQPRLRKDHFGEVINREASVKEDLHRYLDLDVALCIRGYTDGLLSVQRGGKRQRV